MQIRMCSRIEPLFLSLTEVLTLLYSYHNPGADTEKMQLPAIHSVAKDD